MYFWAIKDSTTLQSKKVVNEEQALGSVTRRPLCD